MAAPRTVLVLPIDGSVDPATRARLNASVHELAKNIDGTVTLGDTTFGETAAALGCDPETPACAESVRATLNVDELVYGRTTTTGTETTLVVRRVRGKSAWREGVAKVGTGVTDDRVETELSPLFDVTPAVVAPGPVEPAPSVTQPAEHAPPSRRTRAILITAGGGASLLVGLLVWSNVSSTQDEIDATTPEDDDDFRRLEEQEDKAQRNAILGDVLVVAGVGLAAWGAWMLYEDHRDAKAGVSVTPTVTPTGAGVSIGGRW